MDETGPGSCPVADFFMCDDGSSAYINRSSDEEWTKLAQVLVQLPRLFVTAGLNFQIVLPMSYLRHISGSCWLRMTSNAWIFLISAINFQIMLTGSHFQVRSG